MGVEEAGTRMTEVQERVGKKKSLESELEAQREGRGSGADCGSPGWERLSGAATGARENSDPRSARTPRGGGVSGEPGGAEGGAAAGRGEEPRWLDWSAAHPESPSGLLQLDLESTVPLVQQMVPERPPELRRAPESCAWKVADKPCSLTAP